MKKTILFLAFIFAFSIISFADEVNAPAAETPAQTADQSIEPAQQLPPLDKWSCFQLGFWFDQPSSTANSNVYGLKTGWPISSGNGRVNGAEISWLASGTAYIQGVQGCWIYTGNKELQGLQASFICNINQDMLRGLQAGLVNVAGNLQGFQPGGVNVSKDMMGIQAAALTNVATGKVTGTQLGFFNYSQELNGFQASAFNYSAGKSNGFQLGFVNISNTGGGFQFGVANYIKDAWIPFLPFFNFSF